MAVPATYALVKERESAISEENESENSDTEFAAMKAAASHCIFSSASKSEDNECARAVKDNNERDERKEGFRAG